jgi:capsular exopolysaccharide synthesis family protein
VSRIYDAMRRGASQAPSGHLFMSTGSDDTAVVDPMAEAYQRVLQAIHTRNGSDQGHTILIASAIHGEGTSTIARSLAALLSRDHPGKTVLVDANLRTPSQHRAFGVERGGGLTESITRGVPIGQVVRNGTSASLPLVTSGRPAGNPPAILAAPAFRAALDDLRSRYTWVIVDGPPATVYSDASILAPLTDGVVLVIQAERTRWEVAEEARRTLHETGAQLLGGVLTRRRYHIPDALYQRL